MYISRIDINNYRLLKNTSINCEKDLSLIIGKNNCGKTSLLSALNKCIGSKAAIGNFEYFDFSISFQNKLYNVINGTDTFSENELTGIQIDIYIEYDEKDNLSNISNLLLDLDPNNKTVILRFLYSLKENISILKDDFAKYNKERNVLEPKETYIKFMCKRHKQYFEFKKYSVLYDCKTNIINNKIFKFLDNKDIDISKLIALNYVGAKRNVSNSTETELSTLASNYYEKSKNPDVNSTASQQFENAVDKTDGDFNNIYTNIFKPLTDKISKFGGIKKNETTLKVISQIQAMNLLKDNTTVVYDDQTNFLPENYNGLGFLNLFSIIMNIEIKLSDFRKDTKKDELPADINILFIEEPEAHTHPQMQYIFIKNIKDLLRDGKKIAGNDKSINLQTIMTTHSSHIVAESNFDDIKYFIKNNDGDGFNTISKNLKDLETLYQKEKGVDNNHFKFLKQYLTLNRSEVFFAEKIILIEGDTERILLPAMIKKLDQENNYETPLLSQNISIIEVGNYSEIYAEFIQFIDTKTLIITDIDTEKYYDATDKNGNLKKDKDGQVIQELSACRVIEGTHTSNSSLKYYLKENFETKTGTQKEILTKLSIEDKTIKYNDTPPNNSKWTADKDGRILIVYQTSETNSDGVSYNARSFEDAFFHINRKFFTNLGGNDIEDDKTLCTVKFQGLKNVKNLFDDTKDGYNLAEECVSKKPSLAMDILLNSESTNDKDFVNWVIPAYINGGLEWLQKD
jgi:putative ATP-dependent endonuclease of the OLD family